MHKDYHDESTVVHDGILLTKNGRRGTVQIQSDTHSCSGCALSAFCSGSSNEMIVEAEGINGFSIGQRVRIAATEQSHTMAMAIYLAIPLGLLLAGTLLGTLAFSSQALAGILALGLPALWFGILWTQRNKIGKKIIFRIVDSL